MKPYDELTLADDFMFSKVMQNEELCKELVELLLDVKVGKIEYLSSQKSLSEDPLGRGVRLDVYLKDSDKVFDIEIQTTDKKDLPKRARYYQAMMDIDTLSKGAKFSSLKESYVLFICTFDPFGKGLHKYSFTQKCEELKDLYLNDKTYKVFYNAKAYKQSENQNVQAFLQYLTTSTAKSDFTQKLDNAVYSAKGHHLWRNDYMTLEMKYDELREEALAEGLAEGLEQGKKETHYDTARIALQNNIPIEMIQKLTSLSKEEILAL